MMLRSNQEERTRLIGKLLAASKGTDPSVDPEMTRMTM
jgi:hypothetical protein